MLKHLTIKNYALIKDLELDFEEGFSVITGETGAGKSILLGALDLILGKRADSKVLFDGSGKCIVEGTFAIGPYKLEQLFSDHDLDYDPQTLIRREINAQGKSRAFINDTPVNLNVLQEVGKSLVDIHSQHQNLALTDSEFQAFILDSYAGILDEVKQYRKDYRQFSDLRRDLQQLAENDQKAVAEKDYFEFLHGELVQANLKDQEQELLEDELKMLDHSEEIRNVLFNAIQALEKDRGGVLPDLASIHSGLDRIKSFNPLLNEISNRFESLRIELQDLHREIELFQDQVNVDPLRTQEVSERLNTIYNLQQKHRVKTIRDLNEVLEQLKQKLEGIDDLKSQILKVSQKIETLKQSLSATAGMISLKRTSAARGLEKELLSAVVGLGMPNASLKVELNRLKEPGKDGQDQVTFLFNANKGGEMKTISKVASGGEKSRLMLAIKSMLSKKALLPTIVLDEIDTGVSGPVADRVGGILQGLSSSMQVIAITHLPQIAGKGTHHYQAFKNVEKMVTTTHIKKLNQEQRIIEIAKLLSGKEVTNASVESAKHLLNN